MSKARFLLVPVLCSAVLSANAQDITEAYNLSNLTVQGTARSMGFGNALGSVGADFGTTSVNPAGLGLYRMSEFTFTPSLRMNSSSSQYLGMTTDDNNVHFNINNFGMVFTNAPKGKRAEHTQWKAVSFAFGMNRVADFNRNYSYEGNNNTSSATQNFEADANLYPNDPSSSEPLTVPGYLGYQSYLINYDTASGNFYSVVPFSGGVHQLKTAKQHGHVDDYTLSLGANYMEKLMLGATVGIPSVKYHLESSYSETLAPGNNVANPDNFTSFTENQTLDITGGGINLKIGAIYKITDNIRVGAAFHTPTAYFITDVYTPYISSYVGGYNNIVSVQNGGTATNQFDYTFVTPFRSILSGTYIFKGIGFITADYEYVGYGGMRFIYPDDADATTNYQQQENGINKDLKNTYKGTSNFRVGAEGLITKFFMARAGFGYYGNPYKASGADGSRMDISGGLGFRTQYFFVDVALVHSTYKSEFQPYAIDYNYVVSGPAAAVPVAHTDFSINNIALTVGCKF